MHTVRDDRGVTPLPLELIDWLLDGRVRACDARDPQRAPGVYDSLLEFDPLGPDLAGFWRQHRAWLLTEWARRGGVGQPWAARTFDATDQSQTTDGSTVQ